MMKLISDITLSLFTDLSIGRTFALLLAAWCIHLTALAIYRGLLMLLDVIRNVIVDSILGISVFQPDC